MARVKGGWARRKWASRRKSGVRAGGEGGGGAKGGTRPTTCWGWAVAGGVLETPYGGWMSLRAPAKSNKGV